MSLIELFIYQILHISRQYLFTILCKGLVNCIVSLQLLYQVEEKNLFLYKLKL